VSDADDIAALRITIEEMLDAATIERLGVDDSRDIHTCVLRICSELRSVEAERDRLHRSLDNFINSNANLSEQLSAQTARADALEALNATMHERISGLVAEIAQAKEERDNLAEWKRQQLLVTAWWAEVDAAVRKHPECRLGESVVARALHMIRERDALVAGIEKLVADHAERMAFANTR
jgi:chromosome segregation ATPase